MPSPESRCSITSGVRKALSRTYRQILNLVCAKLFSASSIVVDEELMMEVLKILKTSFARTPTLGLKMLI